MPDDDIAQRPDTVTRELLIEDAFNAGWNAARGYPPDRDASADHGFGDQFNEWYAGDQDAYRCLTVLPDPSDAEAMRILWDSTEAVLAEKRAGGGFAVAHPDATVLAATLRALTGQGGQQ